MPIRAICLIIRLMLACTHWCASQSWLLAFAATSLALFKTWTCDHLEATVWYRTQCHQYGLQFWIHKSPSHFWGRREFRCGAVGISPYHRLIMDALQVKTERITCWGHCFWFPCLGEQQVPCCIDRVGSVHIVYSADKCFWRLYGAICQFTSAHVWCHLSVHQCPSSSASHGALWRSSMMTAWCDSRCCRRWCRTQSMREMLATMMQIHLVVCWKLHQWVRTAVSCMCLTSSKDADIAFCESLIREVGVHQCILKTQQLYETGCGRHCHELPGEANRTSKRKRGDMRNKEYMEAIKEQTQNG